MKKHLALILSAVSCVLAVLCFIKLFFIDGHLSAVENTLRSDIAAPHGAADTVTNQADANLIQQASLLADSRWTCGTPDYSARTVPVTLSVTPKTIVPGDTTAALVCQEKTYPMTYRNGTFSVTETMDLFSTLEVSNVVFQEKDVQRSERLNWTITPRYLFFPQPGAAINSFWENRKQDVSLTVTGISIQWGSPRSGLTSLVSADLLELLDGEERSRVPLPDHVIDEYGSAPWAQTYTFPTGTTHELFVDMVDENNFHYRILVSRLQYDKGGNRVDNWSGFNDSINLYDAQGNLLFQETN